MKMNPYFAGLKPSAKRSDSNWDGLISNGFFNQFSGGGFANIRTGLGTFSRDKVMQSQYFDPLRIPDPELAALFNGNALAARIISQRPMEMFRRGYDFVIPDPKGKDGQNANAELATEVYDYAQALNANEIIRDSNIFGRCFGGGITIMGADDGQDVSLPLNEDRIKSLRYLNFIDRRFLFAHTYYGNPFMPKFGEVETYQVTNAFGDQQQSIVHESRVLRWDGNPVDILKKRMLAGWTLSVLQRPYDVLRAFDSSWQAAANLMVDASQAVFKMKGLMEQIAQGEVSALQTRMALVDMTRSSARAVLLDEENESFERVPSHFEGIPQTLAIFMQLMASAADMPVTILFGREPQGLSATGEADFQHFYDTIASEQRNYMGPKLERLYTLICKAKDSPTRGRMPPSGVEIAWKPLKEPNDLEKSQIYGAMATADAAYATAQVLLPEEIAISRFRSGQFIRLDTEIDIDARKKSMEAELDFRAQDAENKAAAAENLTPGEEANPQMVPTTGQASATDVSSGRTK